MLLGDKWTEGDVSASRVHTVKQNKLLVRLKLKPSLVLVTRGSVYVPEVVCSLVQ